MIDGYNIESSYITSVQCWKIQIKMKNRDGETQWERERAWDFVHTYAWIAMYSEEIVVKIVEWSMHEYAHSQRKAHGTYNRSHTHIKGECICISSTEWSHGTHNDKI